MKFNLQEKLKKELKYNRQKITFKMDASLRDVEYPNKSLVLIGPDGGTTSSKFSSQTHYDQIYNQKDAQKEPSVTSGAMAPVLNYSQFVKRHAPHPFRVRHMKGENSNGKSN